MAIRDDTCNAGTVVHGMRKRGLPELVASSLNDSGRLRVRFQSFTLASPGAIPHCSRPTYILKPDNRSWTVYGLNSCARFCTTHPHKRAQKGTLHGVCGIREIGKWLIL